MSAERERKLDRLLQLYVSLNWMIVPCDWRGSKRPLVKAHRASRSPAVLADYWTRWPLALCACRTGKQPQGSGNAVVDVDSKHGGFATLARLIGPELPAVPQVHSPSGGLHLHFLAPNGGHFSTVDVGGKRRHGLGPGVDFKCDRVQCHLPGGSPASPYRWDPNFNLETVPLLPLPAALIPIETDEEDETPARERRPAIGNPGAYAKAAITKTCDRIRAAVPGSQRKTLNDESLQMGSLAAGLGLDHQTIVDALIEAGMAMQQQAGREPWLRFQVRDTVREAFRDGLLKPRVPQIRGRR